MGAPRYLLAVFFFFFGGIASFGEGEDRSSFDRSFLKKHRTFCRDLKNRNHRYDNVSYWNAHCKSGALGGAADEDCLTLNDPYHPDIPPDIPPRLDSTGVVDESTDPSVLGECEASAEKAVACCNNIEACFPGGGIAAHFPAVMGVIGQMNSLRADSPNLAAICGSMARLHRGRQLIEGVGLAACQKRVRTCRSDCSAAATDDPTVVDEAQEFAKQCTTTSALAVVKAGAAISLIEVDKRVADLCKNMADGIRPPVDTEGFCKAQENLINSPNCIAQKCILSQYRRTQQCVPYAETRRNGDTTISRSENPSNGGGFGTSPYNNSDFVGGGSPEGEFEELSSSGNNPSSGFSRVGAGGSIPHGGGGLGSGGGSTGSNGSGRRGNSFGAESKVGGAYGSTKGFVSAPGGRGRSGRSINPASGRRRSSITQAANKERQKLLNLFPGRPGYLAKQRKPSSLTKLVNPRTGRSEYILNRYQNIFTSTSKFYKKLCKKQKFKGC